MAMGGVCSVCRGAGTHVNPSIDSHGLSSEDFDDDPDFREDYFAGRYDQTCNCCAGRTTVRAIDYDQLTDEQRAALQAQARNEAAEHAERMSELRFGC